jgi:hypothetical protein
MDAVPIASGPDEPAIDPVRTITTVVRAVVERAVPAELPLVDGLSAASDEVIIARLSRRSARDERLGFGVDDVAVLLTPVLYTVLDQSLRKVVDSSLDVVRRRLRGIGRRRKALPAVPDLSPQQVAEIREQVADLARERGVPDDTIQRVGNAVVAVLSDPADGPDETASRS